MWKLICISFYISDEETVSNVGVKCNSEDITITVTTVGDHNGQFNGMIYPKGLSKNSTCMTPYVKANSTVDYVLPLRSCNTMNTDVVSMILKIVAPCSLSFLFDVRYIKYKLLLNINSSSIYFFHDYNRGYYAILQQLLCISRQMNHTRNVSEEHLKSTSSLNMIYHVYDFFNDIFVIHT